MKRERIRVVSRILIYVFFFTSYTHVVTFKIVYPPWCSPLRLIDDSRGRALLRITRQNFSRPITRILDCTQTSVSTIARAGRFARALHRQKCWTFRFSCRDGLSFFVIVSYALHCPSSNSVLSSLPANLGTSRYPNCTFPPSYPVKIKRYLFWRTRKFYYIYLVKWSFIKNW